MIVDVDPGDDRTGARDCICTQLPCKARVVRHAGLALCC